MTYFQAILLGIIQGLTEFLPVSSSGHLVLLQNLFGMKDLEQYVLFDLVVHLGTLFAIFLVYSREISNMLTTDRKTLTQVIIGTAPLFLFVFFIKPIKALFNEPNLLGWFFLTTAVLLIGGKYIRLQFRTSPRRDAFFVGLFQGLALIPGISRSGSTISGARMLGWHINDAVTFSFLLLIPAILGGTILESAKILKSTEAVSPNGLDSFHYILGFSIAALSGYLSLRVLIHLAFREKLHYFAWYCALLGVFCLYYFN